MQFAIIYDIKNPPSPATFPIPLKRFNRFISYGEGGIHSDRLNCVSVHIFFCCAYRICNICADFPAHSIGIQAPLLAVLLHGHVNVCLVQLVVQCADILPRGDGKQIPTIARKG